MNHLEIKNLSLTFSEGHRPFVVEKVSLSLEKGKMTALVGESGSGKTLTSLSILRLLPENAKISEGQILFGEAQKQMDLLSVSSEKLQALRGNKIAMIFQDPLSALNPLMTVGEQALEVLLEHKKFLRERAMHRVKILFRKVGFADADFTYEKYPHELSGGQRQRVMIAMALACDPDVLIADEPTTALDVTTQAQIMNLLKELMQELNLAVLFVTHDLSLVAQYADSVVVMENGKVVESSPTHYLFENPKHAYTKKLLAALPEHFDFENQAQPSQDILLEVRNLNFSYFKNKKPIPTLRDVTMPIFKNEILGIVGESGSGKSTLAQVILQFLPKTSGDVLFHNQEVSRFDKSQLRSFRKQVQIIFQDPVSSLNPKMTVQQILQEVLKVHRLARPAECKFRILEILKKVGLSETVMGRLPSQLSGGQCQRVAIARALLMEPKLLIADEATSSLDVTVQKQILKLLFELRADFDFTLVLISHDLQVVEAVCDRVCVMCEGEIKETIAAKDLQKAEHPYTLSLLAAVPKRG